MLQLAIVITAGHLVFGVAWPGDWVALAVFTALGVVCFASLGVALSHAIPNSESAPAYVNAVFLPMLMIAGVFYDEENAPAVLRDIAEVLPLKHLVDGLSGAIVHGEGVADHALALLVLALWTAAGLVLADPRLLLGRAAGLALAGVEHVGRAAPAAADRRAARDADADAAAAVRAGSRRCGGLPSHMRTIASGVLDGAAAVGDRLADAAAAEAGRARARRASDGPPERWWAK